MADHAPVMLWKSDARGDCDFFNRSWLDFTGRSIECELGAGWAEGVHPDDYRHRMETFFAAFAERRSFRVEYRLRRSDGAYRVLLDQGAPRFEADGKFEGYVGSCVDVTDMREAANEIGKLNAELSARVREREVLLREIHHRVKNNLQLMSSILSLQGRRLHGEARSLIEDGLTRVHAIALVHEKLCETDSMTEVDLADYARDLLRVVRRAIATASAIEIRVEGHETTVAVDQAVSCGLIVNELVTNACKHAFPDGRPGTLWVEVRRISNGCMRLTVRDDGIGLPAHVDLHRPETLGLELVVILCDQLGASLEVVREAGTTFVLTIPMQRSLP